MSSEFVSAKGRKVNTVIGAPSSIGIRPYDHCSEPRDVARAPHILRELGLITRLGATDLGDVTPPPYQDFIRPPGKPRNEAAVGEYSRALADRVADGVAPGQFTVVLGGDCSIVLGCLLGASRQVGRVGLVYVDAHADFATPEQSQTGSVASMCLALAVGHGDSPLARLAGGTPLVRAQDVVLVGRRDAYEPSYGHAALAVSGILDLPGPELPPIDGTPGISKIFDRVGHSEIGGFWIHVDADVLDARVMPAVDAPEPGGPGIEELAVFLRGLVSHPRAIGMHLTLYDPALDPDLSCGRRLVGLFESIFQGMTS